MRTVHVVGPVEVSDPARPSGGNTYHRMVCSALTELGWTVHETLVEGATRATPDTLAASLGRALGAVPDGDVVLLDGLVATPVPEVVRLQADRLRLVLVVHLPRGLDVHGRSGEAARRAEQAVLDLARAVVVTSGWTQDWLLRTYAVEPSRVHVAVPGVAPAEPTTPSESGRRLLCVGAVTHTKGQDVLVEALAALAGLDWSCRCVGSLAVEPEFAAQVVDRAGRLGAGDRLTFAGPLEPEALAEEYARADLVVVASRMETYGMVVTEALAHAVPVVAPRVGGIPEAVGAAPDGRLPAVLVAAGDPHDLARALRRWLTDTDLRAGLRAAAACRRGTLRDWSDTSRRIDAVLCRVAA